MTEEQFKALCELLEKILEKLETIGGDVDALAGAVDSQTTRIMVESVEDY